MKILCTKEEFADLVSVCNMSDSCSDCILSNICETSKNNNTLVNICEITESFDFGKILTKIQNNE